MGVRIYRYTLIVLLFLFVSGCIPLPPSGPYNFITTKPIFFDKIGNKEEFIVTITDREDYELAITTDEFIFPSSLGTGFTDEYGKDRTNWFVWRVEVSVWHNNKLLEKQLLGKEVMSTKVYDNEGKGNRNYIGDISLGILPSLKSSLFNDKVYTVKVKVKQIDERYIDKNLPAKVGIRRSPIF